LDLFGTEIDVLLGGFWLVERVMRFGVGVIGLMLEFCEHALYLLDLFQVFLFEILLCLGALELRWRTGKLFLLCCIFIRYLAINTILMFFFDILLLSASNKHQLRAIDNKIGPI
jgi:hypothetical protein